MFRYDYYCQEMNFFDNIFEKSIKENKIIWIRNEFDLDIKIIIDDTEITQSGCGSCKNIYSNITFSGKIYESGETYSYSGKMSPYYFMCKCSNMITGESDWDNFDCKEYSLLFDIMIDRKNDYLYRYFVYSTDPIELLNND